ncbi:MAG: hypothetical protein EOO85_19730, partial [Pedobacter sp.]
MQTETKVTKIAILGGGPSGLFMFKRLVESGKPNLSIHIFERKNKLGVGMPYGIEGANEEHITNVSDNEIPHIVTSIEEWLISAPQSIKDKFHIYPENFNEYKVLPRLLFGEYLSAQFELLKDLAVKNGVDTTIHLESNVIDVIDRADEDKVDLVVDGLGTMQFDKVIVCTGHNWPKKHEGKIEGYFDAPYPPSKLKLHINHAVAIKGSSLTAIDAIRTLSRNNGSFGHHQDGTYFFKLSENSPNFKMVMYTRSGLLPAVRFHLDDTRLHNDSLLTPEEMAAHRAKNRNFLSLDFLFEKNFKDMFITKDPKFYDLIKDMDIEQFVGMMMERREKLDAFDLLKAEYLEAERSIKKEQSVYWKEMLAVLSFAMNYPAKYLSAEDMLRLKKVLMPLISIVIAFVPQSSCRELLALHNAGVLDIVSVGEDSHVEPIETGGIIYHFKDENGDEQAIAHNTFVDCVGQPHLSFEDFPFKGLLNGKTISRAQLQFQSAKEGRKASKTDKNVTTDTNGNYFLEVPGITINDNFQVVDELGCFNSR